MTLSPGSRLGPYEVLGALGAGGMGEVYRARDTRLGREVALKVLPDGLAASEESRLRLQSEARTISQLSHPHICTLFDVAREGGVDCIVMELLDGKTLMARLVNGPLPLDQTLQFGAQIASALDAAHRRGIVHRDLKPGNVMLTRSGVKLVDFGLAKVLASESAGGFDTSALTMSNLTAEGAILGTVPYMAPEQLEGRSADARADIFALGVVLYEMATGRRPFVGTSAASVASAILTTEPAPISSSQPLSPIALDQLVKRCLTKDSDQRWQSAHDVELQLGAIAEAGPLAEGGRPSPLPRVSWVPRIVALALVAVAAGLLVRRSPREPAAGAIRLPVPPPAGGGFAYSPDGAFVALSPDGSRLAYAAIDPGGASRLWVRALGDAEARPISGSEGATAPVWSPNGEALAFFTRDGKLKRLDLAGGSPVPICDVRPGPSFSGTWGRGGDILFGGALVDAIYRVPSEGGVPKAEVKAESSRDETRVQWPWFLPDGQRFLYVVQFKDGSRKLLLAGTGRPPRVVMDMESNVQYLDPGYLAFAREGTLLAQRFDWETGQVMGAPASIAPQVRYFLSTGYASFAASPRTIAYQTQGDRMHLAWIDRAGREVQDVGSPGNYYDVSIASDGKRALFARTQPSLGTFDVWQYDLTRGVEARITSARDTELGALWLPDGRGIVYSAVRGAPPHLLSRDLATGAEEDLVPRGGFQEAEDISPDGRTLLYVERNPGGRDAWRLALPRDGKPALRLQSLSDAAVVRFSPDGRFVAFLSTEADHMDVYVMPFPGPGERVRVSTGGASLLRWSRGRKEILYVTEDGRMMSVPVRTSPSLVVGTPVPLFRVATKGGWTAFDVSPDGSRFLAVVRDVVANELPLSVEVNWVSALQSSLVPKP